MTKAYRSNLTWEQWELIAGEFPSGKVGGRPGNVALFAVVNAIFYVLCVRVASRRAWFDGLHNF